MKTFYCVATYGKRNRRTGSTPVNIKAYRIKKGLIQFIGESDHQTASYKGNEGACMDILLEHKAITKKQWNFSKSTWCDGGYYHTNPDFQILPLPR